MPVAAVAVDHRVQPTMVLVVLLLEEEVRVEMVYPPTELQVLVDQ